MAIRKQATNVQDLLAEVETVKKATVPVAKKLDIIVPDNDNNDPIVDDSKVSFIVTKLIGEYHSKLESSVELAELLDEDSDLAEKAARAEFIASLRAKIRDKKTNPDVKKACDLVIAKIKPSKIERAGSGRTLSWCVSSYKPQADASPNTKARAGSIQIAGGYSKGRWVPGTEFKITIEDYISDNGVRMAEIVLTAPININISSEPDNK